jgi:hypothetical protein
LLLAAAEVIEEPRGLGQLTVSALGGQVSPLAMRAEIIDIGMISALDVTECLRLLAVGADLMRIREVTG